MRTFFREFNRKEELHCVTKNTNSQQIEVGRVGHNAKLRKNLSRENFETIKQSLMV